MTFYELAYAFLLISKEKSRLNIASILADLFMKATPEEAYCISYLSLGSLHPSYYNSNFNFAEKNIIKLLSCLLNSTVQEYAYLVKEKGDISLALLEYTWPYTTSELSVQQVYNQLVYIESLKGTGVQEQKAILLENILKEVDQLSAFYIIRIVFGTMRLGFSDMTVIDSLSWMLAGNKSLRSRLEDAYNIHADLGFIAQLVRQNGISGLDSLKVNIGIPIRPAAAERLATPRAIIEKIGECIAQPKLDGFRLQIHLDKRDNNCTIRFFSRNLIDMSSMFPDLSLAFESCSASTLIVEGEAIVYNEATGSFVSFQQTVKRKRKHGIEDAIKSLPLRLFLFDILYYNGSSLLDKPHHERRALLEKLFGNYPVNAIALIEEKRIKTSEELKNYFKLQMAAGLEGLVVKRPDALYQAGKRNFNWIKLKSSSENELIDTIDAVILGYYTGSGKRVHFGIGAFLVGVYNKDKDQFETIAKIGTGLKDNEWKALKELCDSKLVLEKPINVLCSVELTPDVWVRPEIVVVIRSDEITQSPLHSAGTADSSVGLALRFPRFLGYSIDKEATQATTIQEIKELYLQQFALN
jgi:DNA ligase 1